MGGHLDKNFTLRWIFLRTPNFDSFWADSRAYVSQINHSVFSHDHKVIGSIRECLTAIIIHFGRNQLPARRCLLLESLITPAKFRVDTLLCVFQAWEIWRIRYTGTTTKHALIWNTRAGSWNTRARGWNTRANLEQPSWKLEHPTVGTPMLLEHPAGKLEHPC